MVELSTIKTIPRFSQLDEKAQLWLAGKITRKVFRKGEVLFKQNSPAAQMMILEKGVLKVSTTAEDDKTTVIGFLLSGDAVCEASLCQETRWPFEAEVHNDGLASILMLSRQEYLDFLSQFPMAQLAIIQDLAGKVGMLCNRLANQNAHEVSFRLGKTFQSLVQKAGVQHEGGILIPLHITRRDLASMIGARTETVIRMMRSWEKANLLLTTDDGFYIPNVANFEDKLQLSHHAHATNGAVSGIAVRQSSMAGAYSHA